MIKSNKRNNHFVHNKNDVSGITLIALVITIIVLLILAGVSLNAVLGENGILTRAESTIEKNKLGSLKEQLDLWVAEQEMSKYLSGDSETLEELLTRLVKEEIITEEQKNALLNNETIKIAGEDFSIEDYLNRENNNTGGTEDETPTIPTAGTKVGDLTNSAGTVIGEKIADGANGEVPVPTGFYYVGGTILGGAVISDNSNDKNKYAGQTDVATELTGNQFVWVPCTITGETGKVAYAQDKQYNDGTTDTKQYYYNEYTDWAETAPVSTNTISVATYGGFYVGRYEAGIPSDADFYPDAENLYAYYKSPTDGTTTKNVNDVLPVIKAKVPSWNYISQENAKTVSQAMYSGSNSVTSNLIDSYAWDTITTWFGEAGKNLVDSTSYGNYRDATFSVSNTLYAKHILSLRKDTDSGVQWFPASSYEFGNLTLGRNLVEDTTKLPERYDLSTYDYYEYKEIATGSSETTKVKNIYDIAGNMWEWTTEEGNHKKSDGTTASDAYAVLRGGCFGNNGSEDTVVYRNGYHTTSHTYLYLGFRVALYIK